MTRPHISVLLKEVLEIFEPVKVNRFFDGTLGAGGHAAALLAAHPEIELYVGCDRDPQALELAAKELSPWKEKIRLVHGSHSDIRLWMKEAKIECFDGVLIDAGVSSMQLDQKARGFSFQGEGPLDMRMNPESPLTAEKVVNRWTEADLARILKEYGEEPRSRAIARAIVAARKKRPLKTTKELVEAIMPVAGGYKRGHLHPATLTFQALRIAVNDELKELENGIERGIESLCPQGRIAVISFHRLEDRIAKQSFKKCEFRERKKGSDKPMGTMRILTKKPLEPTEEEVKKNPRCRSAKLRAAEKVEQVEE